MKNSKRTIILIGFFLVGTIIYTIYFTPFKDVLREDALAYYLKSLEIKTGNFVPILSHSMGWPLAAAPFMFFAREIWSGIKLFRVISILFGSMGIIPLYFISKKIIRWPLYLLPVIFYAFDPFLTISRGLGLAEPLFILVLLLILWAVYKSEKNKNFILLAFFLGGFLTFIRPNGAIILPCIAVFIIFKQKIFLISKAKLIGLGIILFMLSAAPFIILRYNTFGTIFDFGITSNLFSLNVEQLSVGNTSKISFFQFIKQEKLGGILNWIFVAGPKQILSYLLRLDVLLILPIFYFVFSLLGFLLLIKRKVTAPVYLFLGFYLIPLIPLIANRASLRYLYPALPLLFIIIAKFFEKILPKNKQKLILIVILVVFLGSSLFHLIESKTKVFPKTIGLHQDGLKWASWAAKNIQGKIAITEGGDLIAIMSPHPQIGGKSIINFSSGNLETVRTYINPDPESTFISMRPVGITHLALDELNIHRRPALIPVLENPEQYPFLSEVYSNFDTESQWKMKFYKINWAIFDESIKNK